MACAVSAVSRAAPHIRACLHSAGLLQSLTAGKTSPRLWANGQEKATSASLSQRERDTQTVSLPQPQNPTTGWLRKTERKMTGDKLWGGKRSYFLCTKMKGLGTWIPQLVFLKQSSSVWHAKPLLWRRPSLLSVGWNKKNSTHVLRMWDPTPLWRFSSGIPRAINCQAPLVELTPADGFVEPGGIRTRESEEGKRATKTDTKESTRQTQTVRNKKKEVLQSLVYIPQPRCLKYPQILNLYNHPLSKSLQTILSAQERGGDIQHRWCQVLPSGDRWSRRTD